MKLFLCSASPRRSELLNYHNIKFEIIENKLKVEPIDHRLNPFDQVVNIAYLKTRYSYNAYKGLILGADTGIVFNNALIGKPSDSNDALRILSDLCNQTHLVVSACCIMDTIHNTIDFSIDYAKVTFKNASITELKNYINKFQPFDKAGAYGIQDNPVFLENVNGDLSTVKGLPMNKLLKIFPRYGIVK